jgi:hypothetical protein
MRKYGKPGFRMSVSGGSEASCLYAQRLSARSNLDHHQAFFHSVLQLPQPEFSEA